MKKTYLKPDADYIKFYSDEELTTGTTGSAMDGSSNLGGATDDNWD